MKLSEAWSLYRSDKHIEGYSPHTLKAYQIQSNLLKRHLGDIDIESITTVHLKKYLAETTAHLKPSSISHRIRYLKSLFKWAQDEGIVIGNPSAKLKEPKESKRIPKAVSEETVTLLREACESNLERSIFEFLYTTGCRVGEIVKLNRNSLDFDSRSAIVTGKGDKQREVYFNITCHIYLKRYLKERRDSDVALFVTERAPHRMSIAQVRNILKRVARRAGVDENIYPHKLRHTYATHLLNNDAPLELIQSFLGHAKLETTRIYAELSGERRRELYRKYF